MRKNRLSPRIEEILSKQVNYEAQAAQAFLSYAIWADDCGYEGVSNLLYRHSGEERDHMMKFIKYILQRGGKPKLAAVNEPPADPANLLECFESLLQHEINNTQAIYEIANMAQEEKDWATWNFAQWFVKEQIEEETLVMNLLDKLKIAGGADIKNESLLLLDLEIGKQEDEVKLARDSSVELP